MVVVAGREKLQGIVDGGMLWDVTGESEAGILVVRESRKAGWVERGGEGGTRFKNMKSRYYAQF